MYYETETQRVLDCTSFNKSQTFLLVQYPMRALY